MYTPTTAKEFRDGLEQLIDDAHGNGVDVDATWFIRDGADTVEWVVDVTPGPENHQSRETTGAGRRDSGA